MPTDKLQLLTPIVTSVNGQTGDVTVATKMSDLTNDSGFITASEVPSDDTKVDKISGKGLSTNDYTTTEKNKLSGIASGAEVNQNAFSNVVVSDTTIAADSKTDTLTLVAGSNITLTPDATNDKITIAAKDTTYSTVATTGDPGLMTATDKAKLDGIATGANNYSLPTASSSTLGGVKIGTNVSISSGIISVADASTSTKGVVKLSSSTSSTSTSLAATPSAVKSAYDLANSKQSPATTLSGYGITNAYTKSEIDTAFDGKVDKVDGKGLSTNDLTSTLKSNYDAAYTHSTSTHAPTDAEKNVIVGIQKNGTDVSIDSNRKVNITVPTSASDVGAVPTSRTVNGKALSANITLSASDVSALPSSTTYVSTVDGSSGAVTTNAVKYTSQSLTDAQKTQARTNIGAGTSSFSGSYNDLTDKPTIPSDYVPISRTVNGKALSSNVTLSASDVNASSKSTIVSATLSADSWSGDSAPYTYTLSVSGVTATSNQELLPALDITDEQLTALQSANIQDGGQSSGSVTLKAFGEKPTIDVPIRVIVRGDM